MTNHFHFLVEIPQRPQEIPDDDALLDPFVLLWGKDDVEAMKRRLRRWRRNGEEELAVAYREKLWRRMYDVSKLIGGIKQTFSRWLNVQIGGQGSIWTGRFYSSLVEESRESAGFMALYNDMNPVRAGLVDHPADYAWCGYGAAMREDERAKEGLCELIKEITGVRDRKRETGVPERTEEQLLGTYTEMLEGYGKDPGGTDERGNPLKRVIREEKELEELVRKLKAGKEVSAQKYAGMEVGYVTEGWAMGSRDYLEELIKQHHEKFQMPKNWEICRVEGLEGEVYVLRHFRDLPLGIQKQEPKEPGTGGLPP
jgi:hypothetical protein